jgi:hypothetical protein
MTILSQKNYVIISRLDEGDEPDDSFAIQTSASYEPYYRSLSAIDLSDNEIKIYLNKSGIEKIGLKQIVIKFDETNTNLEELTKYIHNIFDDTNVRLRIEKI